MASLSSQSLGDKAHFSVYANVITRFDTTENITPDNCYAVYVNKTDSTQDYRIESNVKATPWVFTLEAGDYQTIRCRAAGETDIRVQVVPVND